MAKYIAIHALEMLDAETKKVKFIEPGQEILLDDKEEAKRLLALGAISKSKEDLKPEPVAVVTENSGEENTGGEADDSEKKAKKGKKGE